MTTKKRLEKLEQRVKYKRYIPVLIVDNENTIEQYRSQIGPYTVIIIDDI